MNVPAHGELLNLLAYMKRDFHTHSNQMFFRKDNSENINIVLKKSKLRYYFPARYLKGQNFWRNNHIYASKTLGYVLFPDITKLYQKKQGQHIQATLVDLNIHGSLQQNIYKLNLGHDYLWKGTQIPKLHLTLVSIKVSLFLPLAR